LVDHPIMYAPPDTVSIQLPGISIEVACFSSSNQKIADSLAEYIKPLVKIRLNMQEANWPQTNTRSLFITTRTGKTITISPMDWSMINQRWC
jgi:hypothetical protein